MRGWTKQLVSSSTKEGRLQSFVWQLGWLETPILQSNNIMIRRSSCGSPSKKLSNFSLYTDKYWNKPKTKKRNLEESVVEAD